VRLYAVTIFTSQLILFVLCCNKSARGDFEDASLDVIQCLGPSQNEVFLQEDSASRAHHIILALVKEAGSAVTTGDPSSA